MIIKKILSALRNRWYQWRNYKENMGLVTTQPVEHKDQPCVIFYFTDKHHADSGRHYFSLMNTFALSGYQLVMIHDYTFIASCQHMAKMLYALPGLQIVKKPDTHMLKNTRYVFYEDSTKLKKLSLPDHIKKFKMKYNIFSEEREGIDFPYYISPDCYDTGESEQIPDFQKTNRTMRLFFSGNMSPEKYNNNLISAYFHKLNRIEMVNELEKSLAADQKVLITDQSQYAGYLTGYHNIFLYSIWYWGDIKDISARVFSQDWLKTLAHADFFLACPGTSMPMCHNIIEAIAVGTIPVTQYPEYFSPPLEHGKTCITFTSLEDLSTQVLRLFSMDEQEIKEMRSQVIEYYNTYLKPETFINNLSTQYSGGNVYFHASKKSIEQTVDG